jgi:hypothetical protein
MTISVFNKQILWVILGHVKQNGGALGAEWGSLETEWATPETEWATLGVEWGTRE